MPLLPPACDLQLLKLLGLGTLVFEKWMARSRTSVPGGRGGARGRGGCPAMRWRLDLLTCAGGQWGVSVAGRVTG